MNLNLTKLKGGGGKDSPRAGANKNTDRKLLTVPNDSESLTDSSGKPNSSRSPTSKAAAFFSPNSAKSPRKDMYTGDLSEKSERSEREEKKEEKRDKDKTEKKSKLSKLGKSSSPKDKKEKK